MSGKHLVQTQNCRDVLKAIGLKRGQYKITNKRKFIGRYNGRAQYENGRTEIDIKCVLTEEQYNVLLNTQYWERHAAILFKPGGELYERRLKHPSFIY